ncbi:HAMP domain-containing sensor histidine kinase [Roseateles sp. SL47]|uniref:sensor histidine kinase n=1 Tax=Roseateles sp. SL47 TaxID=2995138 RepID=UPI0022709788|nr:HAMP domain-containing sensor histidine kinase [Roseateles sp. SL47]WAC74375.1 HAMP domain-containing sensor histidine kinase [Roseateles sp. SL47]
MKLGPVELPALAVPRLGLAAFRRRLVVHLAFVLLAVATVGLVLTVLTDQKQRSYQRYAQGFRQSLSEIVLQLRHPSGQLALLNPEMGPGDTAGQAPVMLPFAAIDFDDQNKAQRAVEMAGCGLRWPDGASLCVAIGSNAFAGSFVYIVGGLDLPPLQGRERGALDIQQVHRARVTLVVPGSSQTWIAPYESTAVSGNGSQRGRLAGFVETGPMLERQSRPVREFRGWLWREGACSESAPVERSASEPQAQQVLAPRTQPQQQPSADCPRRAFYAIRLPVDAWRESLFQHAQPVWPPADLARTRVRVEWLGPAGDAGLPSPVLFDSARPGGSLALSLDRLGAGLQPGETLRIDRLPTATLKVPQTLAERRGPDLPEAAVPWLIHLIRRLPVEGVDADSGRWLRATDEVTTPSGRYQLTLRGDLRSLDRQLALEARPLAWLAAAMLAAIAMAWLLVELGLIRRIAVLTRRAAAVSYNMQDARAEQRIGELDVADLRGSDELGILAGSLADLLQRVKDGLRREQLRAERERDMWHAVGHEIMSPLQSLMLLHGAPDDPSHRYVQRMQQAVKVLYGSAPPSEALASADLHTDALDLVAFCAEVAANAHYAGINDVQFETDLPGPLWVGAEAYALEDAVTHILRNAQRYRVDGTSIALHLQAGEAGTVVLSIRNQGPQIDPALLDKIFEYGVSDVEPQANGERRGQGLFVAKTYLAKMDGTILARNLPDGVVFELGLRTVAAPG